MPLAATVTRMPIRSNTRNYPSFASVLASTGVVPAAAIHVQAQPQGPAIPPAPRSTPPAPPRSRSHTEAPRTQAQPTSASGPRPRPRQAQTHPTRRPSCRRPAQDPMMQTVDYRSYDKVELCRRSGPPSPAIQTLDVKIKPEDGTLLGGGSVSIRVDSLPRSNSLRHTQTSQPLASCAAMSISLTNCFAFLKRKKPELAMHHTNSNSGPLTIKVG